VDPHFSIQHIEDRVSVMFWRLRAAEFYREIGYASPIVAHDASPFRSAMVEIIERHKYVHQPAVGLVDLIDIQQGKKGGRDVARVKIRWSGIRHAGDPRGRHRMLRGKAIYTEVYILERATGTKSGIEQTFASSSCSQCGASLGVNREDSCQFCGTPLTDGRHDWMLTDVRPFTTEMGRYHNLLQPPQSPPALAIAGHTPHADRELDLAVIARVIAMDGELTAREQKAFHALADREGLAKGEADLMLSSADQAEVPLPIPRDGQQAKLQLEQVAYAAMIDGQLSRGERKLLSRYATHYGLSAADVKHVVNDTRRRLYQEARNGHNGHNGKA
jgi:hypothetical protein